MVVLVTRVAARPPCIRNLSDAGVRSDAAMDPAAAGSIARLTAPVTPQATTVDEHRDRRRCHARPDSRWIAHRTYKEGYRGQDHLWSGCLVEDLGCPYRRGRALPEFRPHARGHPSPR